MLSWNKNWLDKLGIAATFLCALHCLLLPVSALVFPLFTASFWAQELFDSMVLAMTMILGSAALYSGFRHHQRKYPFVLLYTGGWLYWYKHDVNQLEQWALVSVAAALIILAHLINIRLRRQQCDCPMSS